VVKRPIGVASFDELIPIGVIRGLRFVFRGNRAEVQVMAVEPEVMLSSQPAADDELPAMD
jgi:hypothetical protein